MALYLPIRAISRSQKIRVGRQTVTRDATVFADITDINTRRDLERHQAIGALLTVGPLSTSNADVVVASGVDTDQGASAIDMTGVVGKKTGVAAVSPSAPAPDAGNVVVARISVPANDTAITTDQITDVRPRG
jgi:hypothetical protein